MANNSNFVDTGRLQVRVNSSVGALPIENANIRVSYTGDPESATEIGRAHV